MVAIRLLVAMSGSDQSWPTGAVYECDEASAARLVAAGRAVWLAPPVLDPPIVPVVAPATETTMAVGGRERAVKPRGRARR